MQILADKGMAALDMLVADSPQGEAFFRYIGSIIDGEQAIDIEWSSLKADAATLKKLLVLLASYQKEALAPQEVQQVLSLIAESSLFAAMGSSSIMVTKEQAFQQGEGITPLEHITRVAHGYPEVPLYAEDVRLAQLLPWLHDIGKMAGVHFLPEGAINDTSVRAVLKEKYGNNGKHTHPSHSAIGTVITKKLLDSMKVSPLTSDQENLLLNMIFHHHNFLYYGEEVHGPLESWVKGEIEEKLLSTLPADQPELVVRFFALLAQFRYADIAATQQHHRHWPGNYEWFSELPAVLRRILPENGSVEQQIGILEEVIAALPAEIQ